MLSLRFEKISKMHDDRCGVVSSPVHCRKSWRRTRRCNRTRRWPTTSRLPRRVDLGLWYTWYNLYDLYDFWYSRDPPVLSHFSFWHSRYSRVQVNSSFWYSSSHSRVPSHVSSWYSRYTRKYSAVSPFGTPNTHEYSVVLHNVSQSRWTYATVEVHRPLYFFLWLLT